MDAKTKEEGPFNKDLKAAIRYLKGKGIIEQDKDIVDKTGYGKSTVSGYTSGNVNASEKFRTKFEEVFELKLAAFLTEQEFAKSNDHVKPESNVGNKYVALLEKTLEEKEADLKTLRSAVQKITSIDEKVNNLETTVNDLKGKAEVAESNTEVLREWLIDQFSKLKKESPQSVAASMGRKREELLKKTQQQSTHVR